MKTIRTPKWLKDLGSSFSPGYDSMYFLSTFSEFLLFREEKQDGYYTWSFRDMSGNRISGGNPHSIKSNLTWREAQKLVREAKHRTIANGGVALFGDIPIAS